MKNGLIRRVLLFEAFRLVSWLGLFAYLIVNSGQPLANERLGLVRLLSSVLAFPYLQVRWLFFGMEDWSREPIVEWLAHFGVWGIGVCVVAAIAGFLARGGKIRDAGKEKA